MKIHTNAFKEQIKEMGRELDSKITYTLNGVNVELGKEQLNSITPTYQGALLKSVMKELDIDSNVYIPEKTILNYQFGVKVNGEYEYINFGNYVVYKAEKQEDTNSYKLTCYDKMLYSMINYEKMDITYPISIRDYIKAICDKLGLTFKNANSIFANYDKEIANELYLDENSNSLGYTFRDVLDELSQVTASCICINGNDELEIRYINETNDTIDEEFLKDINVNFGEKYGPINTIVLSRSADSDNIYYPETLPENPFEFKISDNQIMNFNDRVNYLPDIYSKLNGIEFYINDFSSTGICYYELLDRYNVKIGDNTYSCIMLNDEINITQGLEENIYTEIPEETETDYTKADKTDRKTNQAYIIVNKQNQQIESVTSKVQEVQDNLNNNYYTIEQANIMIQNAETGVTNTFSEAGGNNVFRNTGLWFENDGEDRETNPYEFWNGTVVRQRNNQSSTEYSMLLQSGVLEQEQIVPNGNYSVSFWYKKLIELSTATVTINDRTYELDSEEWKQFYTGETNNETGEYITFPVEVNSQHINIKFETDIDNSIEIYDLMANKGTVKLAYSQNENETTTSTVNISKGITITSSDTDVSFKAGATGIRTVDKSGKTITYFTDIGMTTKQATIENEANIVGILRQRVGDQIWDSFIG